MIDNVCRRASHRILGGVLTAFLCAIGAAEAVAQQEFRTEEQVVETELEIRTSNVITMEMHAGGCKANLALDYWQEGTIAKVETTIDNNECAASEGGYRILVFYRGDDGQTITDEHPETWERDDDQPVKSSVAYEIPDNVDLVRVRSRGLKCECRGEP